MSIRNIIIYSFEHCAAALHAADQNGVEIRLLSSRGAAAAMGSSVFYALVVRAQQTSNEKLFTAALDCGHDCGHALAAIRQGIKYIILSDQFPGRERIANIAEQYGVQIISSSIYDESKDKGPLDLNECADPFTACQEFLSISNTKTL